MHVRKKTRLILPVLFCLFSMLIVACGGGNTGTQQTTNGNGPQDMAKDQIYVSPYVGSSDVKTLDPALTTDAGSGAMIQMMFTGLVEFDDDLHIKKTMAEDYHLESDGLTWVFKLRPNLKFSNGDPLTSEDVIWSIDRALDPQTKSTVAGAYMGLIKGADERVEGKRDTLKDYSLFAPDPSTVKIVTAKKAAYFLQALTYPTSYTVNRKVVEKYGNRWTEHINEGAGSGPFTLTKWQHGVRIDFEPNQNYFGEKPLLKKVVRPFYKTSETAWKAYQSNQLMSSGVPAAYTEQAKGLPKNQYWQVPQLWIEYLTMNYLVKPFDNIKVRQGVWLAINRDQISHNINKDRTIPTIHFVPEGQPGYNENLTGPAGVKDTKGNPELAKKLFDEGLKESNMTRESLGTIHFTVSTASAAGKQEVEAIQQMLQKTLDVTVQIDDVDYNKYLSLTNDTAGNPKGLQMWLHGWVADYPDPQDWLTLLFADPTQNRWNYGVTPEQKANQELMKKADQETDETKRMQMYHEAEQQLANHAAWVPIDQVLASGVRKPCVKGIKDNAMGQTHPDSWSKIYISNDSTCANVSQYR
ncbi:peptide/nickel transport system substrate-binding protein/oligopeptide transport system substrate-binding protein [Thermosporothrix hazakensis]|uniref:Peptide/nickel transport system substrate-binding protein/oligopeptide transport system substrate-binding protein n=2 Tax=Thermosporothrix TaxID=768650 RepID=A0A326TR04_THEHA|nr:peptide ABC transporter substrate-binding protein [Thermosporothrix hazakensis]PZW18239.1 peptide/nickel transport system substrate-binding protein/oligopeptide transport system substrate-binding protein [Thermosporothrix hazakensis]BBH90560.1 oligopeptide-binding protein OppA [Thermosporothrix sp. COM3]GCE48613.1 oligopeptide-binding protein OppA [Thermosporothrix hazakensis]